MEKVNYSFEMNNKLSAKAQSLIPGGAHTYSKGDDQFPSNAPKIITHGKGCYLWDVDGNKFLDFGMALGSTLLGYAYEPILEVVRKEIDNGVNFTRPSYIEAEVAELLTQIIPSAEMVKFVKNGSDATTSAVKLARAYTGRDYIARCAQDPFNSVDDWFIGSTIVDRGVPKAIRDLTLKFSYNDIEGVKKLFDQYPNQIACFIFEPISIVKPENNFLEELQALCKKNGTVLIFDEVVSGFRFDLGGVQKMTGIIPDLTALGKSLGNGFSVSAVVGKRELMELGGFSQPGERVFLASTTYGAETHCLAAARKVIEIMQKENLSSHMWKMGERLQAGVRQAIKDVGAEAYMDVVGYPCKSGFIAKNGTGEVCMTARTLFLQETCARGLLFPYVNLSLAHTNTEIDLAVEIIKDGLIALKKAGNTEGMAAMLQGPVVKPVFRKYN
jgi:glutamate-1-semialdehyde 2,1-aminomutase